MKSRKDEFVQMCRRYIPCPPPCKKEKKKKKKKKEKQKEKKEKKKKKKKNPLFSVVQDVGLGQQSEKTYRLRGNGEETTSQN